MEIKRTLHLSDLDQKSVLVGNLLFIVNNNNELEVGYTVTGDLYNMVCVSEAKVLELIGLIDD